MLLEFGVQGAVRTLFEGQGGPFRRLLYRRGNVVDRGGIEIDCEDLGHAAFVGEDIFDRDNIMRIVQIITHKVSFADVLD
jgi:hypothetical protein